MELWIRSQDKEIFQKTNNLFISHSDENIWSIIDNQNMTKYGKYKTRERALEILDEIQEAKLGNFHYKCPSNVKVSNNEDTIIYKMPKD